MSGIRIIALTPAGREAMLVHRRERMRASWGTRKLYEQFYAERVESEDPYTICIEHKDAKVAVLLPFESLVVPIKEALYENGATVNLDYEVERI